MRRAFVFGKFMPFHNGHEAMIHFAASQCDLLTVIICTSDKEKLPSSIRVKWIKDTFTHIEHLEILSLEYREDELPNTSVTSPDVSEIWAAKFKELLPDHSLLITSEPYGELVAGFMKIRHIPFDNGKTLHPVSATNIRNNTFMNWQYLPGSVKEDLITKVVILGTESTGKTTLTEKLARHFNCSFVLEAGRDIVENSNIFGITDLHKIANEHASRITKASTGNSPLLIIDTDIHITLSYASYAFGHYPDIEGSIFKRNKAALYLYLNNDAPYVQDGTRLSEIERNILDLSHRATLHKYGIDYQEIKGNWQERFDSSVAFIEDLIDKIPLSLPF